MGVKSPSSVSLSSLVIDLIPLKIRYVNSCYEYSRSVFANSCIHKHTVTKLHQVINLLLLCSGFLVWRGSIATMASPWTEILCCANIALLPLLKMVSNGTYSTPLHLVALSTNNGQTGGWYFVSFTLNDCSQRQMAAWIFIHFYELRAPTAGWRDLPVATPYWQTNSYYTLISN